MCSQRDYSEVPYPETQQGHADTAREDDHDPHAFLYVPDLAAPKGWSTHRVPERQPERVERRAWGFRR